jgi:DNA-binding MltR family transcriptional regulator
MQIGANLNKGTKKNAKGNTPSKKATGPVRTDPFLKDIDTSDDFARIVVGVANVDSCLATMLDKFLIDGTTKDELLSHVGIAGNLASRAKLCYTLGLISKLTFNEVIALAALRNLVAHTPEKLTFDSDAVSKKVAEMKWLDAWIERNYGELPSVKRLFDTQVHHKFTTTIALLCSELKSATEQLEKRPTASDPLSMFHVRFYTANHELINDVPKHLKERAAAFNATPRED